MPSTDDSKRPDVLASFRKLSYAANSLNNASDELGQIGSVLDAALKKLNVGIVVWVPFRTETDEYSGQYSDRYDVGYGKLRNSWGLLICRLLVDRINDDEEIKEEWFFNDAPRHLRIAAIEKVPKLFDELANAANHMKQRVADGVAKGRALIAALDLAEKIEQDFPELEVPK